MIKQPMTDDQKTNDQRPMTNNQKPVGAVMVVGGGIAGMQASLDLAEAGFRVYLVEEKPAIGGIVAQLDRAFPTNANDCIMCLKAPKLTEVGRYQNCWNIYHRSKQCAMTPKLLEIGQHIEIITGATVEEVSGEPGNFQVRVRQSPRFIDPTKCASCGDCVAACPVEVPDEFNVGWARRKAIYNLYPQATPSAFAIDKRGTSPCRDVCPIHQRAQGYIALIREKRYADAYRVIKEDNPFPSICGRICNHRCEEECTRGRVDEPVSIMALKRFVTDWVAAHPEQVTSNKQQAASRPQEADSTPHETRHTQKVAIVGSGPAGLTAAHDLARMGYQVTVFEALPVPGGMMRVGIPEYRLTRDLVQREIDDILALGIELKLNTRVTDVEKLFAAGYQAVFLAVGSHQGRKLPIPGADLPDVLVNTDFLRDVALGKRYDFSGRKVLVLGGGNVAIDVARTALRMGAAHVAMSCLENRELMPAHSWEVAEALDEGIETWHSRTFKEIVAEDGKVKGVRCWEVNFRGFLPDGRIDMDEFPETEHILPAEVVIFAIGQRPDTAWLLDDTGIKKTRGGTILVDPETLATSRRGVFAGGDGVTGVGFVVDAIAAGHKAARSIDEFLRGELGTPEPVLQPVVEITDEELQQKLERGEIIKARRQEQVQTKPEERVRDFREINLGLTEEQALVEAERCLSCGLCSECLECFYACKAQAIDHNMVAQWLQFNVGALVLTPGAELYDARLASEHGYGRYPNVLTSMEFERLLATTGPFGGHLVRPSDQQELRKVAWLLCVGSRDASSGRNYCSSVCCMSATKEAILAKEYLPLIEPSIFFPEVRAFGKDSDRYYETAQREHGVRFVHGSISALREVPGSKNLRLTYVDDDGVEHGEEFDMVVLSVGFEPGKSSQELAKRLELQLNAHGFCWAPEFAPTCTSRPGIFAAGAFKEPKDIAETITEASSAAADASRLLAAARGTLTRKTYPPEVNVNNQEVRVGVFICDCGSNIASVVNVPEVAEFAQTLPGVAYAEHNLYVCSRDARNLIRQKISERALNRVVIASCTPRTHEPLFQDTIREAGLNPYLFEMTNIREQDSWEHGSDAQAATEKAKQLVAMAVAKAGLLKPVRRVQLKLEPSALVIGGGLSGMSVALSIAEQGYRVHLVEKESELGGHLRHVYYTSSGEDAQALLHSTVVRVESHPLIHVHKGAWIAAVDGYTGRYETTIVTNEGQEEVIRHGAIVVATGAQAAVTSEYMYGQDQRVLTQVELEERLANALETLDNVQTVVMIQCVGSRDERHPYCSRICCPQALKNASRIKELRPDTNVYVLFRDIRTYGFQEEYYQKARNAGVIFLRYEPERKPQVSVVGSRLRVELPAQLPALSRVEEPGGERRGDPCDHPLQPDLLVLSTGIVPYDNEELARLLKVPLNQDGFFQEAHAKLRPLEFATDGVYVCGLAHSPMDLSEAIAQANGAAVRAVALLSKGYIEAPGIVAMVNERLCSGCGLCVAACPYDARTLDEERGVAEVMAALCQGCGACTVACPSGASQQLGFTKKQELAKIDAALG